MKKLFVRREFGTCRAGDPRSGVYGERTGASRTGQRPTEIRFILPNPTKSDLTIFSNPPIHESEFFPQVDEPMTGTTTTMDTDPMIESKHR